MPRTCLVRTMLVLATFWESSYYVLDALLGTDCCYVSSSFLHLGNNELYLRYIKRLQVDLLAFLSFHKYYVTKAGFEPKSA